jgi:uncharacterized protein (TIGR00369 family)
MSFQPGQQPPVGFEALIGLDITELSAQRAVARVAVTEQLLQPAGLIHGGVYAAIAESLASHGTAVHAGAGRAVMGMSNLTTFMRPITAGEIHAVALCKHAGRTTAVWEVEIADDGGRVCVLSRVTIAIRELPQSPATDG